MKRKTFLVTGATGTISSEIVLALLKQGCGVVCLVRGENPMQRLQKVIGDKALMCEIVRGDIRKDLCKVSANDIRKWHGCIDVFLHGAAAIKFNDEERTFFTNVEGTRHALGLADVLEIPEFHVQSTAYIAGDADRLSETAFEIGQTPRNEYERSKIEAERLVRESGRPFSIHRIGIVVGDSANGQISRFSGYYGFFSGIYKLRKMMEKQWKEDPVSLKAAGVSFDDDGTLHLPVVIGCSSTSRLNLVPLDWVVDMIVRVILESATSRTYHLTHPYPPLVIDIIRWSLAYLKIQDVKVGEHMPHPDEESFLGRLQLMLDHGLSEFSAYVHHEADFGRNAHLRAVLGNAYYAPREITESFIQTLLAEALRVNFAWK